MNKILPLFSSFGFIVTVLGIICAFIISWLKERRGYNLKNWAYLPMVLALIATFIERYTTNENFNKSSLKIDSLNTRISFIKDSNSVLRRQYDSSINSHSLMLDSSKRKAIEIIDRLNSNEKIRLETELKLKQELLQTNKSLSEQQTKRLEIEKELHETSEGLNITKEKIAARKITKEQRNKFIAYFIGKPKTAINLTIIDGDDEARMFAVRLRGLFVSAGLHIKFGGLVSAPHVSSGIFLQIPTGSSPSATLMQKALNEIGIKSRILMKKELTSDSLYVLVGHKPIE